MERKEKIKLLQDLSKGISSIEDLKEKTFLIKVGCTTTGTETQYFINSKQVDYERYFNESDKNIKANNGKVKINVAIV